MRTWNLGKRHVFGWNEKKLQPTTSAKFGNGLTHGQGMNYEIYLQRAIPAILPDPSIDERPKAQKAHMWWGASTFFTRKWLSTLHSTLVTARAAHLVPQLQWGNQRCTQDFFSWWKNIKVLRTPTMTLVQTIVASTSNVLPHKTNGSSGPLGKNWMT